MNTYRRFVACGSILLLLSGCGTLTPPSAEATFEAKVQAGLQNSQDLLDQFKIEDAAFKYISGNTQNCNTVQTETALLHQSSAAPFLRKRLNDKKSDLYVDMAFLKAYGTALASVATNGKMAKAIFDSLVGAAASFAAGKDAANIAKGLSSAVFSAEQDLAYIAIARYFEPTMSGVIDRLKHELATPLRADQEYYFSIWDSCVREKLAYMREIALDPVKYARDRGELRGNRSFAAQSSHVELNREFIAYRTARTAQLKLRQDFRQALDDIQKANTDLAAGKGLVASAFGLGSKPSDSASTGGSADKSGADKKDSGSNFTAPDLSKFCQTLDSLLKLVGEESVPACAAASG